MATAGSYSDTVSGTQCIYTKQTLCVGVWVCVCVCTHVCACLRACVYMSAFREAPQTLLTALDSFSLSLSLYLFLSLSVCLSQRESSASIS